ncbi:MAG TPA: HAMP domain-containing sensor histidine kinase [Solirubrobacteraceae bacterium]|nr:HAMP domain-containing sensor histidine kinase [Solirubrobacteraceae bacterium]
MPAIARQPEVPHARQWSALLRRYRLELLWAAFAIANCLAVFFVPDVRMVPFFFVWISLTIVYWLRLWPLGATLVVLGCVIVATGTPEVVQAFEGSHTWDSLLTVPLTGAMFLAMVWQARRRVDALRIAEQRTEERRSLLERQERFIHDASHELRTPVTIATGHLELARTRGTLNGEIDVALDELARINAIIERLLVLAAADQPDFLCVEEVDLEAFLEDVFLRWSATAPRAWRLGALEPVRLVVDRERLRIAVDALLENAVKYTEERDMIELRARRDRTGWIVVEVEDEGCGIAADALERIFDRFGRADAGRTRAAGGVGLGLAIVDAIAKGHQGSCTVRSTPHGSVFALALPLEAAGTVHSRSEAAGDRLKQRGVVGHVVAVGLEASGVDRVDHHRW